MSFQYSLNNLRTNSPYYSLNNLNTENGIKILTADLPVVTTQSGGTANIALFESSSNIINFGTKGLTATTGSFSSLNTNTIVSGSGSFNSISSTGIVASSGSFQNVNTNTIVSGSGSFNSISSTGIVASSGSFQNVNTNTIVSGSGSFNSISSTGIVASSGAFQNVNTSVLNATTINITNLNIPNLTFSTATGSQLFTQNIDNGLDIQTQTLNSTGTITSNTSLRTTSGVNAFDFTDISSSGDLSVYNAGGAEQGISFRFDGTERLFLQQNGELMTSKINCSGAFTGSNINVKDLVVKDDTNLFNLTVNNAVNAPNANITSFALTASSFVTTPFFTGTKAEFGSVRANTGTFSNIISTGAILNNMVFSTSTGGNLFSNVFVKNGQVLQFNQADNTQIVRIEPGAITNNLSFFNSAGVLQTLYSTSASGADIDRISQLGTKDITNTGRIFNGDGTEALPSYSFVDDRNSGFRRVGSDNIGLSLGGTQKANFQTNLLTLGSSSNNSVGQAINGDLQVGRTSFNNVALINLGFSGAVFGVNPGRQGFITVDGTNMTIANTQANTGSTSEGSIFITPASSANTLVKRADGKLTNTARVGSDYNGEFINNFTGGFGVISRTPNSDLYQFGTQTFGNNSGVTLHGAVSNVMSNITVGRTNFSFSAEEALTMRPFSNTGSRTIVAKLATTVDEAFGYTLLGMSPSGATSGGKNVSNFGFINNSNALGGFYICTNTNTTVPNTYPRYFVDSSGFHEFSVKSQTGVFSINSVPFSVGIGEAFSSTRGQGRFLPLSVASLSVVSYTGGSEHKMRGTSSSNNDHSAFTTNSFSADFQGVYDIRYNLNMNSVTATDTVFIRIKVASTTRQVATHRIETVASNASNSLLFNCNIGELIELFIQPDLRNISLNNDSSFTISYAG